VSLVADQREEELNPFTDLTPDEISQGDPNDVKFKNRLANILAEALVFVRSTQRNNDYFEGFTLSEVLQDRINEIGPDVEETAFTNGEIFLNQTPLAPSVPQRLSLVIRNSTGLTKLEELVVLRARVNAAVDALLAVRES